MVKNTLIGLAVGLLFLVLQSTWLYGNEINPFRLDLVFIVIILLAGFNRLGTGIVLSAFLGMMVDILSWDLLGLTMILYVLIFLVYHFVWTRTNLQSLWFQMAAVFILQAFYGFLVQLFLKTTVGLAFSRVQLLFVFIQALITMLIALPIIYFHRVLVLRRQPLQ